MRTSAHRSAVVAGGITALLALTACHASVSIGKDAISKKTLQKQVATKLAAKTKQPVPTVTCPGDLAAKVGTTMICQLMPQHSTDRLPVTLTVNSVSNGVANYSISVGQVEASSSP